MENQSTFAAQYMFGGGDALDSGSAGVLEEYPRDLTWRRTSFRDGSIANLWYLANGDKSVPKEHFEVFCEGRVGHVLVRDVATADVVRDVVISESKCAMQREVVRRRGSSPKTRGA